MPFIPHTADDVNRMLSSIGADSIESLFDEIPEDLKCGVLDAIPAGMSEMEITELESPSEEQKQQIMADVPTTVLSGYLRMSPS